MAKADAKKVMDYFKKIKDGRSGMYKDSYNEYMKKIYMEGGTSEGESTEGCSETVMVAGKPKKRRGGCGSRKNARKRRKHNSFWVG